MTKALYPGSFDPLHNGHLDIIEVAAKHFDEVVVASVRNPQKTGALFDLDERQAMIEEAVAHLENVEVTSFASLTVDLAHEIGASFIVKGLRVVQDFETELMMARMNHAVSGVDTLFIPASADNSYLASNLLRELARFGADVTAMVPMSVAKRLTEKYGELIVAGYDDDYDEDGYDDDVVELHPEPEPRPRVPGSDVEHMMRRLHEMIGSARPMPLSTSVMINRDEILDLLDEAIERLPDELRAARWLLKEREEYLAKVRREGDEILDQARTRAERMVQRTEVVKASEARARKIVQLATDEASRLRNECEDFCDQKLGSFEIVLERTLKMVGAGRAKLQGNLEVEPAPSPDPGRDPGDAVFDQDLG